MFKTFLLILIVIFISCKSENKKNIEYTGRIGIETFRVAGEKHIDSIVEYLKIDGKEYANQIWLVDKDKDTVGGNYFDFFIDDTTKLGNATRLSFTLTKPAIKWDSDIFVVLPFNDRELNDDFSNLLDIKLDTLYSLKDDGIPHPELSELNLPLNRIAEFEIEYGSIGKKIIRGIIVEKGTLDGKKYERRLFFNDSLHVTD
tara:strand:+ start:782 stop:1384 length:603 start_codon:yes stop_codon:yes gene_type:complete